MTGATWGRKGWQDLPEGAAVNVVLLEELVVVVVSPAPAVAWRWRRLVVVGIQTPARVHACGLLLHCPHTL